MGKHGARVSMCGGVCVLMEAFVHVNVHMSICTGKHSVSESQSVHISWETGSIGMHVHHCRKLQMSARVHMFVHARLCQGTWVCMCVRVHICVYGSVQVGTVCSYMSICIFAYESAGCLSMHSYAHVSIGGCVGVHICVWELVCMLAHPCLWLYVYVYLGLYERHEVTNVCMHADVHSISVEYAQVCIYVCLWV